MNQSSKMAYLKEGVSAGLISNEGRAELGMLPVEGGDTDDSTTKLLAFSFAKRDAKEDPFGKSETQTSQS
jgi:hypothetical protein